MVGTMNRNLLLGVLPIQTIMFPVVAPFGTGTTILPSLHPVGTARTPLNVTVLLPCIAPKLAPEIVTCVPIPAGSGVTASMVGACWDEVTTKVVEPETL